jgi:hypothetical protein
MRTIDTTAIIIALDFESASSFLNARTSIPTDHARRRIPIYLKIVQITFKTLSNKAVSVEPILALEVKIDVAGNAVAMVANIAFVSAFKPLQNFVAFDFAFSQKVVIVFFIMVFLLSKY